MIISAIDFWNYECILTGRLSLHCVLFSFSVKVNGRVQNFQTTNQSSHTHTCSALHNPVTLTFDLLTSGSMNAEVLSVGLWLSLVLIAQAVFGRPYYRSCLWYNVSSVCLSSVTFCIVAKRYVLAKNCLKEWIGNQGQRVDFLGRHHISTSGFAYTATETAVFALYVVLMGTLKVNIFR